MQEQEVNARLNYYLELEELSVNSRESYTKDVFVILLLLIVIITLLLSLVPRLPRPTSERRLLQILGPSVKRLFHSKNDFRYNERLFEWKRRLTLDQKFEATVPDRLSPIGRGGLGTRLADNTGCGFSANIIKLFLLLLIYFDYRVHFMITLPVNMVSLHKV